MKRITALLLAGTLLTGSFAAEAASLRSGALIQGNEVRLGHLFEGLAPEQADQVVIAAPAPGRHLRLDPVELTRIATAHGVEWRPSTGADRIVVERESTVIGPDVIREALTDALAAAGIDGMLDLTLDNRTLMLHVPAEADAALQVRNLTFDAARGRVTAELLVPAAGIVESVGARAVEVIEVPVLSRRVMPGEVITDADLDWTTVAVDRAGSDTITTAEELIGQTVRRGVAAQRPIRARDVRAPIVVPRGSMVTILLETPTMTLTAQGRALADGAVGEVIRVANTTSSRIIDAKVSADGLVSVLPAGAPVPAPAARHAAAN